MGNIIGSQTDRKPLANNPLFRGNKGNRKESLVARNRSLGKSDYRLAVWSVMLNLDVFAWRFFGVLIMSPLAIFGCSVASFDEPFTMYTSVASTDLDGDGRPDIAMASSYISGSPPHAGNAVVLLQNHSP